MFPDARSPPARPELFFDPYLTCNHPGFADLSAELIGHLDKAEGNRKRRRRASVTHMVSVIAANLAKAVLTPAIVAVPLRSSRDLQSRYAPKGVRQLANVVDLFDKAGMIRLVRSTQVGRASIMEPLDPFRDIMHRCVDTLSPTAFRKMSGEEIVLLAQSNLDWGAQQRNSEKIDYDDTPDTERFREEVRRINAYLANADIAYVGPPTDKKGRLIDASPPGRFLQRIFNIPASCYPIGPRDKRFDRGGRLYHRGVFWQGLSSELRQHIRIDGELIAYLDFKSMFLRLAYAEVGIEPPAGDLYRRVSGIETADHRKGIKTVVNAMLFRDGPLTQLPRGDRAAGPKALLPPQLQSAAAARCAILSAFSEIAEIFERGHGLELMFTESQIMVATVLRLAEYGITALPIHDGLIIAVSKADQAEGLINEITVSVTGFRLPMARKALYSNDPLPEVMVSNTEPLSVVTM